jgi:hypothetical protein
MYSKGLIGFSLAALWLLLFLYLFVRFKSLPVAVEINVVIGVLALAGMYVLNRALSSGARPSDPIAPTLLEAKQLIDEVHVFVNQLCEQTAQSEDDRQRLRHVYALMVSTLEAVNDADKRDLAPAYLEHFVRPAHDWLKEYARLSTRAVAHADLDLKEAADRIPDVERSFASLNEQMHTPDVTNLALLNLEIRSGLYIRPPNEDRLGG